MATTELSPSGSAEHIRHAVVEEGGHDRQVERFRIRAGVLLALLAVLLALCNMGGENARKRAIIASVRASDQSISHESAISRQLQYQLSADNLAALAALSGAPSDSAARRQVQQTIDQQRALVAHPPAAEPGAHGPAILSEGESIQELETQTREYEAESNHAEEQNEYFEFATAILEVGLVLGSVAIIIPSGAMLAFSLGTGALGILVMLNGFFLLIAPPWL